MGIINLAMTCKTDTNSVFISAIVPRSDKLNEKTSKVTPSGYAFLSKNKEKT